MSLEPLICADTATRVSSVLNRDVKQFGKKHMFDASEETCWNSDQGTCQWVTLDFPRTVKVSQFHIQFQGGFSSRLCTLEALQQRGRSSRGRGNRWRLPQHLSLRTAASAFALRRLQSRRRTGKNIRPVPRGHQRHADILCGGDGAG
ncbi:nuclear receptor 2C2-associated protein isoform X1 [Mycteria americana]|uniref:nuclear receptor 2C2-associated protein isoform X1 n=2 Tax=Mycteria americana TaxID=33587 RepID=UPI003F58E574